MTIELEIQGIPFTTADEAIQYTNASGRGVAVSVEGIDGYLVVERAMADRLDEARLLRAYYYDHEMPDRSSQVVSVPVN